MRDVLSFKEKGPTRPPSGDEEPACSRFLGFAATILEGVACCASFCGCFDAVNRCGVLPSKPCAYAGALLGTLVSMLVAEKSGFHAPEYREPEALQTLVDQMTSQAVENMKQTVANGAAKVAAS